MSITVWINANDSLGFRINPGSDFGSDKEKLSFITTKAPIYNDDSFSHWECPKQSLGRLLEVFGNKVIIKPEAREYLSFYRVQTTDVLKLPKMEITVKALNGMVPDTYQKDYIEIYDKRLGVLGLIDTGGGKTLCSLLRAANITYTKLLIVAPAGLLPNWQADIEDILGECSTIYTGSITKANRDKIDLQSAKVVIVNYEMLLELSSKKSLKFDSIIIDEAHLLGKNTKSYRAAKKIIGKTLKNKGSVQALTATPLENDADDLWYLTNLVNPELAGDRGIFLSKFREPTYWIDVPNFSGDGLIRKPVKFKTIGLPDLKKFISAAGLRVPKSVFIRTQSNFNLIHVPMTDRQAEVYESIRTELLLLSKDNLFWLSNPLTRLSKILQAAEGVYNIYPEEEESGKMDYVRDYIQSNSKKIIVWFRYIAGTEILHKYFQDRSVLRNGTISPARKFLARVAFQGAKNETERKKFLALKEKYQYPFAEKEADVLITTYSERSGVGDNFQCCDQNIFMSYDFSATSFQQAAARIVRRDTTFSSVNTSLVISERTIERKYLGNLLTKIEANANILNGTGNTESLQARDILRMLR